MCLCVHVCENDVYILTIRNNIYIRYDTERIVYKLSCLTLKRHAVTIAKPTPHQHTHTLNNQFIQLIVHRSTIVRASNKVLRLCVWIIASGEFFETINYDFVYLACVCEYIYLTKPLLNRKKNIIINGTTTTAIATSKHGLAEVISRINLAKC